MVLDMWDLHIVTRTCTCTLLAWRVGLRVQIRGNHLHKHYIKERKKEKEEKER